jgi:hypothetical protein
MVIGSAQNCLVVRLAVFNKDMFYACFIRNKHFHYYLFIVYPFESRPYLETSRTWNGV